MKNRRMRPFAGIERGPWLKSGSIAYISTILLFLFASAILYFSLDTQRLSQSGSFFARVRAFSPVILWISNAIGIGLLYFNLRKCTQCLLGPGKRLASAMDKMSKGDLGWKLTLRRGDEMAEVAESVTKASQSLAERISKIQSEIVGIVNIEDYLIDSVSTSTEANPYFLKAMRTLKINTNRLRADINEFHVSIVNTPDELHPTPPNHTPSDRSLVGKY